jgi:hypothetical protein
MDKQRLLIQTLTLMAFLINRYLDLVLASARHSSIPATERCTLTSDQGAVQIGVKLETHLQITTQLAS